MLGSDYSDFDRLTCDGRDPIDHLLRRLSVFLTIAYQHAVTRNDDEVVGGVKTGWVHVGPDVNVLRELFVLGKLGRIQAGPRCGGLEQYGKRKENFHLSSPT